jgi:hypothetical protein
VKGWKPTDLIAFILAVTVCIILILASLRPILTGIEVSVDKARMLAGIIGAIIAMIANYLGGKKNKS